MNRSFWFLHQLQTTTVYLVCSLYYKDKEVGDAIPGWNNYIEINLLNNEAASNSTDTTSSVRDERSTTDAGSLTSSTKTNTNNSSVNQDRTIETKLSKSDDSIDSGLNTTLNNTLTWDDLFNSISKWKPLGYGLCGVVRLALIKVSSITTDYDYDSK